PERQRPRRDRSDRLPEERRLRQLLERRPDASAGQVVHLFGRRRARRDGAAPLADGAADHGRAARRVARRTVCADEALCVLSAADHARHRSGGDRSAAARHHREGAARARRDLDLGPLARVAEDGRHAGARRGSQRQHHHPRAGARGVRVHARPRRVRSGAHQGRGTDSVMPLLALALSLACIYAGPDVSRAMVEGAGVTAVCTDADLAQRELLGVPGTAPRPGVASPTRAPWINANGWRFTRQPRTKYRYDLPAGKGALAVARVFAYGADAALQNHRAHLAARGET